MNKSATYQKLDFRFATDEIDASDIEKVVNDMFSEEYLKDSEYCFRKEGPKIKSSEV